MAVSGIQISNEQYENILTGQAVEWKRTGLKYRVLGKCKIATSGHHVHNVDGVTVIGVDNNDRMQIHAVTKTLFIKEFTMIYG